MLCEIIFKTTSLSYQKSGIENFLTEDRWEITVLANENTKGLALNGRYSHGSFSGHKTEHELLLGRNTEYVVYEADPTHKKVTVILLDGYL